MKSYDVLVIGAGSGLIISSEAARRGLKTAIIEEGPFGGTCLNRGCIPSKMLLHVADIVEDIKRTNMFGINAKITSIDWKKIQRRVWNTIDPEAKQIELGNKTTKNITIYKTRAVFEGRKILRVGKELITAKKIFICAGTRPRIPQISGLEKIKYHTSDTILKLSRQPKSLAILGGGYIGAELAHYFSTLGTKVIIIDRGDKLLKQEDQELAAAFTKIVSKKYCVVLNADIKNVKEKGKNISITSSKGNIDTECLLVATGRIPNTDILKVENSGIKITQAGYVEVNKYLETNIPGIWAIGDIAGKYFFKHSANLEAVYAVNNAFGKKKPVDYSSMPHAIFTSPQIAGVGMTEQELREKKQKYLVGKYKYINTGMGKAIEDTHGFVKVLAHPTTKKILGCHILGSQASTLIHEIILATKAGLTTVEVERTIHVHPALPEVIQRACANLSSPE